MHGNVIVDKRARAGTTGRSAWVTSAGPGIGRAKQAAPRARSARYGYIADGNVSNTTKIERVDRKFSPDWIRRTEPLPLLHPRKRGAQGSPRSGAALGERRAECRFARKPGDILAWM